MRDGSTKTHFVEHVKGFPAHPMTTDDLVAKSIELLGPSLGSDSARTLCETVLALDQLDRLDPLVAQLLGPA